jgi:hypothetical protein
LTQEWQKVTKEGLAKITKWWYDTRVSLKSIVLHKNTGRNLLKINNLIDAFL